MTSASRKTLRCAVYTRKSSDEGLDQAFNSLDAQREACAAYVTSQVHEGWKLSPAQYDDGGYSGGNMQRPALQHLLAEIASGKVDVVMVYKIDRLTRSLADFARMVELFDKHQVSFVSVTQSFNTTSSMGRLTLNVLLSFAQFEREVTGERIRDKIAASKAKGMWMGGVPPLGYNLPTDKSRTITVNKAEAEAVRTIFNQYLELGSVNALEHWLKEEGFRSKKYTSITGNTFGGIPLNRGALYYLLRNPVYVGLIRHKGVSHPGQHPGIVDKALFDKVQSRLDVKRRRRAKLQQARSKVRAMAPLTGRIFDAAGEPMVLATAQGKFGKRYSYYVSSSLQKGSASQSGGGAADDVIRRVSAQALEYQLAPLLARLVPGHRNDPLSLPSRIELHASAVHLTLPKSAYPGIETRLASDERIENDVNDPKSFRLIAAVRIRNRRGRTEIRSATTRTSSKDPVLIGALQRAHSMVDLDPCHLPVCHRSPETQYGRRLLALAFLAPDLQRAILDGTQPADLTLDHLMAKPLPAEWGAQRQLVDHI
jgi:DNA invertase Pin-like site-specific DNA recombinase